jgi:hypothetical protein
LKYSDLIVLSYRTQLNEVGEGGMIIPKDSDDVRHVKYISQGLEIDLVNKRYKTVFGPRDTGSYIALKNGYYKIGNSIILTDGFRSTDGLIGIYDRTNLEHLRSMLYHAYEANADYSGID